MSSETQDLLGEIYERLDQEMPSLRMEYPDSWVAFGLKGMLFPPDKDKWALFRKCQESGLIIGQYVIDTTTPEAPGSIDEAEILFE